jgi:predicted metal-dependent phosphotriesterase family hydrolase
MAGVETVIATTSRPSGRGHRARERGEATRDNQPGITPNVEKVHRAAARASNRTGKPIMAHSRPASGTGPEQMRIFAEEGVDPAKVQIAHTGDSDDLDYIEALLETGCYIGASPLGHRHLPPDRAAGSRARSRST